RSLAAPGPDRPVASASTSSDKSRKTKRPDRRVRTGYRSLCGRLRKYIFATTQAGDVHVRQRARVGRDGFREKQKSPFQEKFTVSISRGKRDLQSPKFVQIAFRCRDL